MRLFTTCLGDVVARQTADDAEHVLRAYAANYAVTMFTADVGVFRPQKF